MHGPRSTIELELRGSWTADEPDLSSHLHAFVDLLCTAAGLPPEGVAVLGERRDGAGRRTRPAPVELPRRHPSAPLLAEPRDGTPEPLTTPDELRRAVAPCRRPGPVAVDAERASGYRYSQRAYLVQLRREGAGTVLIDPIALPDLVRLDDALGRCRMDPARGQPGPALPGRGRACVPRRLFDTELVGRLLGSERVALGTMVEQYLGVRWRRGIRPPTGPPGRCRTTGWSMPRSTSSC